MGLIWLSRGCVWIVCLWMWLRCVLLVLIYGLRIFLGLWTCSGFGGCCDSGLCDDLFGFGLTVDFRCLVCFRVDWFGISVF